MSTVFWSPRPPPGAETPPGFGRRGTLDATRGPPVTLGRRLRGTEIDLNEELGKVKEKQMNRPVTAQETRRDLFLELQEKRIPIEEELRTSGPNRTRASPRCSPP